MALSDVDRKLLQSCLSHKPRAWEDFVNRFLGLVMHVVRYTAKMRGIRLTKQDEEDLAAEFFLAVIQNDFAILRRFRGESSLATYLTVVARRLVVRELLKGKIGTVLYEAIANHDKPVAPDEDGPIERIGNREEVARLLEGLSGSEADVVRMYHLEGKSYREISSVIGMPENSIGPMLSRARAKMRRTVSGPSA